MILILTLSSLMLSLTTGIRRGMICFAGGGQDSRASDLFINRADSEHLGSASWETPVAEIVGNLDVVDQIEEVGDMAPWGSGPDIGQIQQDPTFTPESFPGDYLKENFPKVDFFKSCALV